MAWPSTWADGDDFTPTSADSQSISSLSVGSLTVGGASVLTSANVGEQSLSTLTVTGKSYFSNAEDVTTAGVTGAVIIGGDGTGAHIAIDGNEIMQKSSSTSVGAMDIMGSGGALWLGAAAATDSDATLYILSDLSAVQSPSHFGRALFLETQTFSTVTVAGVSNGLNVVGRLQGGSQQFSADSNGVISLVTIQGDSDLSIAGFATLADTVTIGTAPGGTGGLVTNAGTALRPVIRRASDLSAGFYYDGTAWAVSDAGRKVMGWTNAADTPEAKIGGSGDGSVNPTLQLSSVDTGVSRIKFEAVASTQTGAEMQLDHDGTAPILRFYSGASYELHSYTSATLGLHASNTSGETGLYLYDPAAAAILQVTVGAADSGGAGYRLLRIINA